MEGFYTYEIHNQLSRYCFFLGYPALVLGYLYEVITDGFSTGRFVCSKHTDAATEKFCNNHD